MREINLNLKDTKNIMQRVKNILTKAEEKRVHCHRVYVEKYGADKVSGNTEYNRWDIIIM